MTKKILQIIILAVYVLILVLQNLQKLNIPDFYTIITPLFLLLLSFITFYQDIDKNHSEKKQKSAKILIALLLFFFIVWISNRFILHFTVFDQWIAPIYLYGCLFYFIYLIYLQHE